MEWAKYQERERKKEEEEREKERVAYAQIDWHDFVVVETVDFQPNEQGSAFAILSLYRLPGKLVLDWTVCSPKVTSLHLRHQRSLALAS